jgi:hypothetical protein
MPYQRYTRQQLQNSSNQAEQSSPYPGDKGDGYEIEERKSVFRAGDKINIPYEADEKQRQY